jgi:hypothetical protein
MEQDVNRGLNPKFVSQLNKNELWKRTNYIPVAKRFRNTEIWDEEWYMMLPCHLRNLCDFVRDKCDISGVWSPNWVITNAYIRHSSLITEADLLSIDNGKQFRKLPNGKIFCLGFIDFQYVTLSLESRVHIKVLEVAMNNGVYDDIAHFIVERSETIQAKRSRISEKIKRRIFAEDEYNCQYCGNHFSFADLCLDHIVPLSKNGDNEDENLTTACKYCNAKKWETDVFKFIATNNITPLISLSKKLNTLSKVLNRPQEKDKEEDKDKELDKEKVKDSSEAIDSKQNLGYALFDKSVITARLLNDQAFVESLQMTHRGKNITQAWDECWVHFTSDPDKPPPENDLGWWKRKLNGWLTNKKAENGTSKTGNRKQNTSDLAAGFAARHGTDAHK